MRVAVIADNHFDEHNRFEECIRIHDWIADDLEQRSPDLILDSGDVFERKSSVAERNAVVRWVRRAAGIAPLLIVRGNHDVLGDLRFLEKLRTKYPVKVEETCGVHYFDLARFDGKSGQMISEVQRRIAVAAVAWPRKAEILARGLQVLGSEGDVEVAGDLLRNVLRGLGAELESFEWPRILLMHAMVRGSETSLGQPLVGCDMEIGLEDLGLVGADFIALGHIHKGQDWEFGGVPIVYPGSPRRTAFGELESKAYVLIDFVHEPCVRGQDDGWMPHWERIETPATPMLLLVDEWGAQTQGTLFDTAPRWRVGLDAMAAASPLKGAEVRLRYTVDADQREAAKKAAAVYEHGMLELGAVSVKCEEMVRAVVRARAPEVAKARTLHDKLRASWKARSMTLPPEREAKLLEMATDLETEIVSGGSR